MSKHTPEPWAPSGKFNNYENGVVIYASSAAVPVALAKYVGGTSQAWANAERLTACVNACTGIPTDALKEGAVKRMKEALEEAGEYFDGRADAEYFTDSPTPHPNEEMRLLSTINEALASFKEEG